MKQDNFIQLIFFIKDKGFSKKKSTNVFKRKKFFRTFKKKSLTPKGIKIHNNYVQVNIKISKILNILYLNCR